MAVMRSSATLSPDGRLWYLPIKIPTNGQNGIEQILVFDAQAMATARVITPIDHSAHGTGPDRSDKHRDFGCPSTND